MQKNNTSRFVLNYFWGNMVISVASLISFPIFTRVFSVSDYGILSLIFSTLNIVYVFSKMGIQNSIIRYYPEFESGEGEKKSIFFSTYVVSMLSIGIAVGILYFLIVPILTKKILAIDDSLPFYIVALLVPAHSFYSALGNFFKARQEPVLFNILSILETYLPLVLGILAILYFGPKIIFFFLGAIAGKVLYISYFGKKLQDKHNLSVKSVSSELLEKAFLYGSPLMLFELVSNLLAYGDRFLIKYFLSEKDVAVYAVGYNLAMYMVNIFVTPINTAVQVEYMGIWTRGGKEKTEEYLSKTFKAIMYFGTIFCVMALLNFKYVIIIFASSKYLESIMIAPFVITSLIVYSLYPIFGAGIYISGATRNLLYCVSGALVINFAANIILIPRIGIMGAAIATFVSYVIASGVIFYVGRKALKIRPYFKNILICLFAGYAGYELCRVFEFNSTILNIMSKSIASVTIYSIIIVIFDNESKNYWQMVYSMLSTASKRTK